MEISAAWKIEAIEDTRQRGTDRKPIPGSGDIRSCECCTRAIEVHAIVTDGTERAIIGTQCAKRHGLNYGLDRGNIISPTNKNYWSTR